LRQRLLWKYRSAKHEELEQKRGAEGRRPNANRKNENLLIKAYLIQKFGEVLTYSPILRLAIANINRTFAKNL